MGTYMVDAEECIKQINAMSKTDFHQRILRGVATSEELSCLRFRFPSSSSTSREHSRQVVLSLPSLRKF